MDLRALLYESKGLLGGCDLPLAGGESRGKIVRPLAWYGIGRLPDLRWAPDGVALGLKGLAYWGTWGLRSIISTHWPAVISDVGLIVIFGLGMVALSRAWL